MGVISMGKALIAAIDEIVYLYLPACPCTRLIYPHLSFRRLSAAA
jgi:hypothetical protein